MPVKRQKSRAKDNEKIKEQQQLASRGRQSDANGEGERNTMMFRVVLTPR